MCNPMATPQWTWRRGSHDQAPGVFPTIRLGLLWQATWLDFRLAAATAPVRLTMRETA
jgi:hypothetical protein